MLYPFSNCNSLFLKELGVLDENRFQISSGLNHNINVFDTLRKKYFHVYFFNETNDQMETLKSLIYYNKQKFDSFVFLEHHKIKEVNESNVN